MRVVQRFAFDLFVSGLFFASLAFPTNVAIAGSSELRPFQGIVAHNLPSRLPTAPTGSEFLRMTSRMSEGERENAIYEQIRLGNVPSNLRVLKPVYFKAKKKGVPVEVVLYVTSDYLAIGTDKDHVLMPMNLYTAARLASEMGYTLPTACIVDTVYKQADMRLASPNLKPNSQKMHSNYYYEYHNRAVQDLISRQHTVAGQIPLVAGHKKDLILSRRLFTKPDRIAIYGWHNDKGVPIQPISTVHSADYADYSHGVRLVSQTAYVNGEPVPLYQLLSDPAIAPALNREGAVAHLEALLKPRITARHVIAQN